MLMKNGCATGMFSILTTDRCLLCLQSVRDVSFCSFLGHCSLVAVWGKDSPTYAASNSRSPFPHLCTEKLSRTCYACSRGGSLFLHYCIHHLLSPFIMVRLKMTYLEIFQSNIVKSPPIVTSIVMLFHGFRSAV